MISVAIRSSVFSGSEEEEEGMISRRLLLAFRDPFSGVLHGIKCMCGFSRYIICFVFFSFNTLLRKYRDWRCMYVCLPSVTASMERDSIKRGLFKEVLYFPDLVKRSEQKETHLTHLNKRINDPLNKALVHLTSIFC